MNEKTQEGTETNNCIQEDFNKLQNETKKTIKKRGI
jgi:hypothetical protein